MTEALSVPRASKEQIASSLGSGRDLAVLVERDLRALHRELACCTHRPHIRLERHCRDEWDVNFGREMDRLLEAT